MNFQAILVANLTGFLLILFLLISQVITCRRNRFEDHVFSWMMHLALIACLIEPLTFYIDGKPGAVNYWINLLGNTYLYGANAIGSFLFCVYVDRNLYRSEERVKRIYYKFSIIVGILILFLLLNIRLGFFFNVDENNVYHREPLVSLFYIYMLFCCIFSIGVLYVHRFRHGKVAFFPIYMYLAPIITGSVIQMMIYGVSLAWLGTAIGVVALYMSMLSQSSFLDSLTGLYNRLFFNHTMDRLKSRSAADHYGIMIDMDLFKEINDTYGHSAGDQALRDAAGIFRKVVTGSSATVFRFAGDEFIIIVKSALEEEVTDLEDNLRQEADRFNAGSGRKYKVAFSMGHAKYDPDNDTNDSFLKKIDEAMYADKTRRKACR